jgi:short-subunit dehydrogenase
VTARFADRYGPWAVVLGASEGLGAAFAFEAAARGCNVAVVARRADLLEEEAERVAVEHGVATRAVAADLATVDGMAAAVEAVADVEVGLVVCNAALGLTGGYLEHSIEDQLRMLDLNCRGPLLACDAFVPPMLERGRGGVVIMSSATGVVGSAGVAVYSATKAFDLALGEALYAELGPRGVDVVAVIGPAIDTPNFRAGGPDPSELRVAPMHPHDVAKETYDTLRHHAVVRARPRERGRPRGARQAPPRQAGGAHGPQRDVARVSGRNLVSRPAG